MLSILIVTWNTRDLLVRCLEAVQASATGLGIETETIVVDNGSTDGSAEVVRSRFPSVRLITNDRNRGYALANNQAYAVSHGDQLLLLNTDASLTPEALRALLGTLRAPGAAAGAVPRLVNPDHTLQVGYHRDRVSALRLLGSLLHNGHLWTRNPWARAYLLLDDPLDHPRLIPQPAATCWLLKRAAIEDARSRRGSPEAAGELFTAEPYPIHFNDVELAERLGHRHHQTVLTPEAEVVHDGGASVERLDPYLLKEHFLVSELLFFRANRSFLEYLFLKIGFTVICAVLLVLTWLGLLRRYFTAPVGDRHRAVTAQLRILRAVLTDRLPKTFW